MGKLILLKHLSLDQRLQSIYLCVRLALNQSDLSKGTFADGLESLEVCRCLLGSDKAKKSRLSLAYSFGFMALSAIGNGVVLEYLVKIGSTVIWVLVPAPFLLL